MAGDTHHDHLERLVRELDARGLIASVVKTRSGPTFLRVVNPEATSLSEIVTCAPAPDSAEHYFWWSWGELLHQVDDPSGAAGKLARVLEPRRS
jgi:hypothetical protein